MFSSDLNKCVLIKEEFIFGSYQLPHTLVLNSYLTYKFDNFDHKWILLEKLWHTSN